LQRSCPGLSMSTRQPVCACEQCARAAQTHLGQGQDGSVTALCRDRNSKSGQSRPRSDAASRPTRLPNVI
jgi:hypothetical protein